MSACPTCEANRELREIAEAKVEPARQQAYRLAAENAALRDQVFRLERPLIDRALARSGS